MPKKLAIAATALLFLTTACSGAGSTGNGSGGGTDNTITALMVGNPQMEDIQKLTADNFTKQTGITVKFTILPENELRDKVTQDVANQGGQYRTTLGVDIEACTDTGGGYDVGWTQGGEWEKFTVNATTAKTYTVNFRIASGFASGTQVAQIHLEDKNGVNLTGVMNVIATGGWQTWTNLSATATLPAGSNVIKLVIDGSNNGFNINYVSLN